MSNNIVEQGEPVRQQPVREPMTICWLIERTPANSGAFWLTAAADYTNDANAALQFARKQDAEGFLKVFVEAKFGADTIGIYRKHIHKEQYIVTEHEFVSAHPVRPMSDADIVWIYEEVSHQVLRPQDKRIVFGVARAIEAHIKGATE